MRTSTVDQSTVVDRILFGPLYIYTPEYTYTHSELCLLLPISLTCLRCVACACAFVCARVRVCACVRAWCCVRADVQATPGRLLPVNIGDDGAHVNVEVEFGGQRVSCTVTR